MSKVTNFIEKAQKGLISASKGLGTAKKAAAILEEEVPAMVKRVKSKMSEKAPAKPAPVAKKAAGKAKR